MIGVVDVGLGNIASVHNMFGRLGILARAVLGPEDIHGLDGLVLPGVGSFDTGTTSLHRAELFDPVRKAAADGLPTLGICLGMQLLCESSEEGTTEGLGVFPSKVRSLTHARPHSVVPHVGWAGITTVGDSPLFDSSEPERFYFTHSFAVAADADSTVATCDYDSVPFAAALREGSVFAVQFHPEKSHVFGMRVLERFWEGPCRGTG